MRWCYKKEATLVEAFLCLSERVTLSLLMKLLWNQVNVSVIIHPKDAICVTVNRATSSTQVRYGLTRRELRTRDGGLHVGVAGRTRTDSDLEHGGVTNLHQLQALPRGRHVRRAADINPPRTSCKTTISKHQPVKQKDGSFESSQTWLRTETCLPHISFCQRFLKEKRLARSDSTKIYIEGQRKGPS